MPNILEEVLIQRDIVTTYEGCVTESGVTPPVDGPPPIQQPPGSLRQQYFALVYFSKNYFSRHYFL